MIQLASRTAVGDGPRRGFGALRAALSAAVAALMLAAGAPSAYAINGEAPGTQGYYQPSSSQCDLGDFAILCDDRTDNAGVVSCHQRNTSVSPAADEGLALGLCPDNPQFIEPGSVLESNVVIQATNFADYNCSREGGVDVCVVCGTYVETPTEGSPAGRSGCVRIVNDGLGEDDVDPSIPPFEVSRDPSQCAAAIAGIQGTFSSPHAGFIIYEKIATVGASDSKKLVICGDQRSWSAVPPETLPQNAISRASEGTTLVNTPLCVKKASGRSVCF